MVALAVCACAASSVVSAPAAPEYNPNPRRPIAIGPEARRLIIGFRVTPANIVQTVHQGLNGQIIKSVQARTSVSDVAGLVQRVHLSAAGSRQVTSSMHVLYLPQTLYGADVESTLKALRADPAVEYADVDQRRYPHAVPDVPDDPLFVASANAAGQWYMMTPSAAGDAAATDAVSAWGITTGSTGVVIADVDTGVRFDHPDLLRAGLGGRLLPGYDFVSGDVDSNRNSLGTFLIANDGDGWDPDPSDPGDWINSADQSNALFPASQCPVADSSWHGTRVMGILGALTNNAVGVAGMTWNSYLLPVRALGKCGGYDSDIIAAMEWAGGVPGINGVPDNPYPASIINLSLGGDTVCSSDYIRAISELNDMKVLIVVSAGNASGPVDAPGNCAGVLTVAGLRNVGTKVGYSSLGSQVSVAAPAGNCVTTSGPCLKSIDTTTNTGLTVPSDSSYTNEINPNLGTSFSAPIVSGIAALMRTVNANLSPAQVIERIQASASSFPQPAGLPVCPAVSSDGSGECACPNDGSQCGAGMVNALNAVMAAERPIAAVALPGTSGGSSVLDARGSAAACGRTLVSYSWTASGGVTVQSGAGAAQATVMPTGSAGTITLTVTDSSGAVDTAVLSVSVAGAITAPAMTPTTAGSASTACPAALSFAAAAPVVTESFSPASIAENAVSTLTITLSNLNAFDLTQANLTETLPANLSMATSSSASSSPLAPATTCAGAGAGAKLTNTANTVTLSLAVIPAQGSCAITIPVQSATAGSYTNTVAAKALTTGPAGPNAAAATATLTVAAPSSGGGGELDWWDALFAVGVLLAGRRHRRRSPRQPNCAPRDLHSASRGPRSGRRRMR